MKRQLVLPIALLFGLLLLSLLSLRGEVLALAIPLIVYLGAALWAAPEKVELTLERQISGRLVSAGTPVTVQLTVCNQGASIDEVCVTDPLPAGVKVIDGQNTILASLPAGGELTLSYTVQGSRGDYPVAHAVVSARETLGLFWQELYLGKPARLRIKPSTLSIRSIPIRPPQTRGFSGPIPARQGGRGVDFFSVREYQPGDPQRSINWRIAARHPYELYTTTHQIERVADVGLILDARIHMNIHSGSDSLFEHAVQAAATLADAFLRDGNRVGLLVYGDGIRSVFPGYGRVQKERILEVLAMASVGHNYVLENLKYLPTRFFPPRSQVVLISTLVAEDLPVLVQLRAHGYAVIVICPDVLDFEIEASAGNRENEQDPRASYAYRVAHAERTFLLQEARRAGVQVADWCVGRPLELTLQTLVRRQRLQRYPGSGL